MHTRGEDDAYALRALLRGLRGAKRQRDVAADGAVSLSLYKKLESGRSFATQLGSLIRIARALGADRQQRGNLIRLARPDLAPVIWLLDEEQSGERPLEALSGLAGSLLEATTRREALQRAVERLYPALHVSGVAFALERGAAGRMEMRFSMGALPGDGRSRLDRTLASRIPPGRLHAADPGPMRTLYVPIRDRGRTAAVLGVALGEDANLGPRCTLLLETVAAILEARFAGRAPATPS